MFVHLATICPYIKLSARPHFPEIVLQFQNHRDKRFLLCHVFSLLLMKAVYRLFGNIDYSLFHAILLVFGFTSPAFQALFFIHLTCPLSYKPSGIDIHMYFIILKLLTALYKERTVLSDCLSQFEQLCDSIRLFTLQN